MKNKVIKYIGYCDYGGFDYGHFDTGHLTVFEGPIFNHDGPI